MLTTIKPIEIGDTVAFRSPTWPTLDGAETVIVVTEPPVYPTVTGFNARWRGANPPMLTCDMSSLLAHTKRHA